MEHLDGKVAVVTGGASGIGLALAGRFLAEGMNVAIADIEEPALRAAEEELAAAGGDGRLLAVPTDVSDPAAVDALAQATIDRFGSVHVICNNAGVGGHFGTAWETPLAEWEWVFSVNVWGVIHGIRSFVPLLVAQGEGHVVNTASLAGWAGAPTMGPYCASKHAVLGMSESLLRELETVAPAVGVTVLCPGMVNTRIISSERNWPASLGPEPRPEDPLSVAVRDLLLAGTTEGPVEPSAAADAVVNGIKANRFIVTTHPDDISGAAGRRLALAHGEDLQSGPLAPDAV